MRALRIATAASVGLAFSLPALAHAADLSGLLVLAMGMLLGVPVALALVILIVVSLRSKGPRPVYAKRTTIASAVLGVIYPLMVTVLGAPRELVVEAALYDVPILVLAVVSIVFARRLAG